MPDNVIERSYGCSYGCGNPYDYVFVNVSDGTTEFLCLPCFVRLCESLIEAVTNPDNPIVRAAVADMPALDATHVNGSKPKRRGKNAPVGTEDDDLLEAFDTVITVDDLPDEFK